MSNEKLTDAEAFDVLIRAGRKRNKISWTPTGDQADTDALNRAIRRAAGRDDPESADRPFPWKALGDDHQGKDGL